MKEAPEMVARMTQRDTEYLTEALPLLEEMVARETALILARVDKAIREGNLTGDMAVALWHQFRGPEGFLGRVKGRIKTNSVILTQAEKAATTA